MIESALFFVVVDSASKAKQPKCQRKREQDSKERTEGGQGRKWGKSKGIKEKQQQQQQKTKDAHPLVDTLFVQQR
jgi:hypothetical protein